MDRKDKRDVAIFLAATFILSWAAWILSGVLQWQGSFIYDRRWLFAQAGVFVPTLTAAILMTFRDRASLRRNGAVILIVFAVLALGGVISEGTPASVWEFSGNLSSAVIIAAVTFIAVIILGRYYYLPDRRSGGGKAQRAIWIITAPLFFQGLFLAGWFVANLGGKDCSVKILESGALPFLGSVILAFSMNLILGGPLGEEFGWRGFLFPLLLKNSNANGAGATLGLIMALWHFPIDITSEMGIIAVIFRLVFGVSYSVLCTWFFIRSGGSILVALFCHAAINILPDLGFSGYQESLMVFTLFMVIAAIAVAFRPEMRK